MGMKSMDLRVSELERRVQALEKNGKPDKDKELERRVQALEKNGKPDKDKKEAAS